MDEELLDLLAAIRDVLRGVDDPRAAAALAAADQAVDARDPEGALADLRYFIDEREGIQHEHEAAILEGEAIREGDQQ